MIDAGIISAGLGLVGSLFGRKPKAPGVDFVKLRNDALKAGFNPLTALGATGGQGYARDFQPNLASGAFISEALQRGVDTVFNRPTGPDAQADLIRQAKAARDVSDVTPRLEKTFGFDLAQVVPFRAASSAPKAPPLVRLKPGEQGFIGPEAPVPVRDMHGRRMMLEPTVARRFNISPGDQLVAEDLETFAGDLLGEWDASAAALGEQLTGKRAYMIAPNAASPPRKPPKLSGHGRYGSKYDPNRYTAKKP